MTTKKVMTCERIRGLQQILQSFNFRSSCLSSTRLWLDLVSPFSELKPRLNPSPSSSASGPYSGCAVGIREIRLLLFVFFSTSSPI